MSVASSYLSVLEHDSTPHRFGSLSAASTVCMVRKACQEIDQTTCAGVTGTILDVIRATLIAPPRRKASGAISGNRSSAASYLSCPSWARTRTLLIPSQVPEEAFTDNRSVSKSLGFTPVTYHRRVAARAAPEQTDSLCSACSTRLHSESLCYSGPLRLRTKQRRRVRGERSPRRCNTVILCVTSNPETAAHRACGPTVLAEVARSVFPRVPRPGAASPVL